MAILFQRFYGSAQNLSDNILSPWFVQFFCAAFLENEHRTFLFNSNGEEQTMSEKLSTQNNIN